MRYSRDLYLTYRNMVWLWKCTVRNFSGEGVFRKRVFWKHFTENECYWMRWPHRVIGCALDWISRLTDLTIKAVSLVKWGIRLDQSSSKNMAKSQILQVYTRSVFVVFLVFVSTIKWTNNLLNQSEQIVKHCAGALPEKSYILIKSIQIK